jgi:hypothetical protein
VFFLNLLQWIYWRLWFYPFYVIYAVFYGAIVMVYDTGATLSDALDYFFSSRIVSWPAMPGWGLFTVRPASLSLRCCLRVCADGGCLRVATVAVDVVASAARHLDSPIFANSAENLHPGCAESSASRVRRRI